MPRPRQLDMNTLTAAPKHAELVAVLRGLHMATGASQGVIITGTDLTLDWSPYIHSHGYKCHCARCGRTPPSGSVGGWCRARR